MIWLEIVLKLVGNVLDFFFFFFLGGGGVVGSNTSSTKSSWNNWVVLKR